MLILDLWGISFHAVVVFGLGKNLLFKSVLGHCVWFIYLFIFQLSTKMTRWLSFTTEFQRRVQRVSCIYLMNYAMKTNSTYFCWTFLIPIPWRSATASFLPIMFHIGTKKCQPYTTGILHTLTFKIWAFILEMSNS